ncbi:MAG: sensor histidine kinase, partial [Clostridiales bacterium]|nr:sensor histidine kinase [Clostridiales bacterium]
WFLARISKKAIDRPIRVGTVFLLGTLLLLFEEVVLSEIELISTPSIAFSLDVAANRPFFIVIDIVLYLTALILALVLFAQKSENTYYKEMIEANDQYLKAQAQYYEAVERSNTEIRKIRHDMKNNLTVLSLLLENGDHAQMKSYLAELDASVQSADTGIRNGNRIADAILFDKKQKAEKAGCRLSIDGTFTYTGMSAVDTCAILGNLIDNAIEATAPLPIEKREITLRFTRTDYYFIISQANPCLKRSIFFSSGLGTSGSDKESFGFTTSKSDKTNHGFGLLNLKEAIARYQGEIKITCEPSDDVLFEFRAEIIIPLE